jgi:hypothetical protein
MAFMFCLRPKAVAPSNAMVSNAMPTNINLISANSYIENMRSASPIHAKPNRRVLSTEHIRTLIDLNYVPDESWYNFASIAGITAVLRRKYSPDITPDMVYDSLLLDPPLNISYNMDAPGCRFIKRVY